MNKGCNARVGGLFSHPCNWNSQQTTQRRGLGIVYVGRAARVVCVCVLFVFVCNIVVSSALRQDQTKRAPTYRERTHVPPSKSKATRASEIVDGQSVQLG